MSDQAVKKWFKPRYFVRALVITLIIWGYAPTFWSSFEHALDFYTFNDDVRQQIWPMLRYVDSSLFPHDYIANYLLECLPIGYKFLYWAVSGIISPIAFSSVLYYLLFAVVLFCNAMIGKKLAGEKGLWLAVFMTLGLEYFQNRMIGGLPRSFAFPCMALILYGVVYARPLWTSLGIILSALCYPIIAAIGGPILFIHLIVLPAKYRQLSPWWTIKKRVICVLLTAVLCVLSVIPVFLASEEYGYKLSPADIAQYPEYGPGGRYPRIDGYPYPSYTIASLYICVFNTNHMRADCWPILGRTLFKRRKSMPLTLSIAEVTWFVILIGTTLVGLAVCRFYPVAARILMFWPISVGMYYLSAHCLPYFYLPPRYIEYVHPMLLIVQLLMLVGVLDIGLRHLRQGTVRCRRCLQLVCVLGMMACFAMPFVVLGRNGRDEGYMHSRYPEKNLMKYISSLDRNVLVAGWMIGPTEDIPYLARRSVLVAHEMHTVFHSKYVMEMRQRAQAVINAYWPLSSQDIIKLKVQFGVTHFLLDARIYRNDHVGYFRPFTQYIHQRQTSINLIHEIRTRWPETIVFDQSNFVLVDLNRLQDELNHQDDNG